MIFTTIVLFVALLCTAEYLEELIKFSLSVIKLNSADDTSSTLRMLVCALWALFFLMVKYPQVLEWLWTV